MSALDIVLVLVAAAAGAAGWTMGLIHRALSWLGLLLGIVLISLVLPSLLDALDRIEDQWLVLIAILLVVAAAMAGQALGMLAGGRVRVHLDPRHERLDAAGGAVMGVLGVLIVVWLVAPAARTVPGWGADQVEASAVVRGLDAVTPDPPDTFRALRGIVGADPFPEVFSGPTPGVEVGTPPESVELAVGVADTTRAAITRIHSVACAQRQDGTGFFIEDDLVVTNAHVVAGSQNVTVYAGGAEGQQAEVVAYDPERDLAVLRVATQTDGAATLDFADGVAGEQGVVFGHPGGGDLRLAPAEIAERVRARGRDLYDEIETTRQVFFLATSLEPGDSGGPLVNRTGEVVAVIFAIAPEDPDVAFALTAREVQAFLSEHDLSTVTSTDDCI